MIKLAAIVFSLLLVRCSQKEEQPLFTAIEPADSGIQFENKVNETMGLNLLTNEYTYLGGGMGVGDINNDGLQDL